MDDANAAHTKADGADYKKAVKDHSDAVEASKNAVAAHEKAKAAKISLPKEIAYLEARQVTDTSIENSTDQ